MILAGSVVIVGLLIAYFVVRTRWYKQGLELVEKGDYDGASAIFSRIIKYYPQDVQALKNRAIIHQYQGNSDNARKDFERAVARGGRMSIELQIDHAYFLLYLGDYDKALAILEQVLHSDPSAIRAQIGKVQIYFVKKDYEQALAEVEKGKADLLAQKEKYEKFKAYMKHEQPHTGESFDSYARILESFASALVGYLGRIDESLQRYTALIEAYPKESVQYNDRAEMYFLAGDYESALADFLTIQEKFSPDEFTRITFNNQPASNIYKAGLAVTYYVLGDVAQAQSLWRELCDYSPQYHDAKWVQKEFFWSDAMTSQAEKLIASLQEPSHA